ncbi:hypothetical protein CF392_12605 [Tamilnaduibacter salinus]|uniref:HupE/UreJ protein n=1 Tax=Tamilnaduibacter salinus TaxID=1484056 RepID=A0A2A2HZI9_9GAMM|nr:HupE/UreJ family protein [Tamilnaduibacter salinus]PAV25131.1 hypothetical protein CF392_12605 [Tamilnaduibacter salinus]
MKSLLLLLGLLGMASFAEAHKSSDGFLYLDQRSGSSTLRLDVALRDLALIVPLDRNGNGQVTGAEWRQNQPAIRQALSDALSLSNAAGTCALTPQQHGISQHSDGPYATVRFALTCPDGEPATQLDYDLLASVDAQHRGLLQQTHDSGQSLAVLTPGSSAYGLSSENAASAFLTFLWQGVLHLVLGFDHVLFLLVLILPATMRSRASSGDGLTQRLWSLAAIVTAFTVAHSITLVLAALGIVRLPIGWVELVIALSIAVAALNIFWPLLGRKTWKLAFGFGLIHGFGFASVLGELTSETSETVKALAGFNIGVELGQLALLCLVFPALYSLSAWSGYRRAVVPVMAFAVAGISLYWAAERVTGL